MVLKDGDIADYVNPRRIHGNKHHAVVGVPVSVVAHAAAHHDQKSAGRMRRAGDEPFSAIHQQVIAISTKRGLQVGWVTGCHIRLRHGKGRANVALQQWQQPLLILLRCREQVQQ